MAPTFSTAGIVALGPAILFAIFYTILGCLYIWQNIRHPTYAFITLVFFCLFRVLAFILRGILAASDGAKENNGVVISETIFFALGIVSILYSVFILTSGREAITRQLLGEDEDQSQDWILSIILDTGLTDLTFTAAAGVSIASAAYIGSDPDKSVQLRKVAIILYLCLTICVTAQAANVVYRERKTLRLGLRERALAGRHHTAYTLCVILFLLLIRQAYLLATFNSDRKDRESLWYPLVAVPEFLAACLFSVPGLIPPPEEIPEDKKRSYWWRCWRTYNATA